MDTQASFKTNARCNPHGICVDASKCQAASAFLDPSPLDPSPLDPSHLDPFPMRASPMSPFQPILSPPPLPPYEPPYFPAHRLDCFQRS